jgi:outer membrane receptor protein involved in Fe transport
MKNWLFTFYLLLLYFPLAATHGGSIKGLIADAETNAELAGIPVKIEALQLSTSTNEIGQFSFNNLEAGDYTLSIHYVGYADQQVSVRVTDAESTPVKIALSPAPVDLSNIDIRAAGNAGNQALNQLDVLTRPLNSAQDVLRLVPGLFIAQHAGGGKAEQIFMRGFDIDHGTDISIETDGMPVNMVSHAHGQGYADLHYVIPELIERVDFQKGPYTTSVGNFATAGHVKFETAQALRNNFVTLEGGQFDTYRGAAGIQLLGENAAARGNTAYLATEAMFSNGYFEAPQNFKRFNLFGKVRSAYEEGKVLTVSASQFNSSWLASGQIPVRAVNSGQLGFFGAVDPTEGGQTSRRNLNIQHVTAVNDRTSVSNQLFVNQYDFELYSNFTFFLDDPINGDQIRQRERRNLGGYKGSVQHYGLLLNRPVNWEGGIQVRYDATRNSELSRSKGRVATLSSIQLGDIQELNAAVYADANWQLSNQVTLQAGVRYDQFHFAYHNRLDSSFQAFSQTARGIASPKLSIFWDISTKMQLFAQAGRGFHSNDTRVVTAQTGRAILPAAMGFDLGFRLKPFPRLLLNGSLWTLDLEQEFVYVGDAGIVEPSGRTLRRGVDLSLRYQLSKWLFADFDYNWTDPRSVGVPEGEHYIPLAPIHSSIGGLRVELGGWMGSLRYRYLGDRPANEDNSLTATGYTLLDAVVNYTPVLKSGNTPITFSLSGQNLANVHWKEAQFDTESRLRNESESTSEIHFTPGTPFFVKAGLSFRF